MWIFEVYSGVFFLEMVCLFRKVEKLVFGDDFLWSILVFVCSCFIVGVSRRVMRWVGSMMGMGLWGLFKWFISILDFKGCGGDGDWGSVGCIRVKEIFGEKGIKIIFFFSLRFIVWNYFRLLRGYDWDSWVEAVFYGEIYFEVERVSCW